MNQRIYMPLCLAHGPDNKVKDWGGVGTGREGNVVGGGAWGKEEDLL